MDGSRGYQALRAGAAWLDLSTRGKLKVTGEDRARLLHAMSTNDVQQLTPGRGCYAFFLNAQGRVLLDAHIFCFDDHFLIDTEPETPRKLHDHLDRFIIADDVALEDLTGVLVTIGVEGPQSAEVLAQLGAPLPPDDYGASLWAGRIVAKASATGAPGYWIFCPAAEQAAIAAQLEEAGAVAAAPDDIRTVRVEHGQPRYGEDILETTIPQESQQMHAVSFNKGCYIGQEIVERVRSRGHANKRLVKARLEGREVPANGSKVPWAGKGEIEVTSAARSPGDDCIYVLGYTRA